MRMRPCQHWIVVALVLQLMGFVHNQVAVLAAELTFPTELQAAAGTHTLTAAEVDFETTTYAGVKTRGYNGGIPGPTFRMNPGETLLVNLVNNLDAAHNVACTTTGGEFCETATTNLHTHGLHVSPKGTQDGWSYNSDNIFAEVAPGATGDFRYAIPSYHMGGTHWYHPHHHHATAVQAGGGLAGVLIVNDPEGYLPTEYANMVEKVLFFSGHNLNTLQTMAVSSQSVLLTTAFTDASNAGLDTLVFLTNGQLGPTMTISSHIWHRFRMVYAAVEQQLNIQITTATNGAACTWYLIAKDGVYLTTIPRTIQDVVLFPGARADVAVSCTCNAYPCTATVGSSARRSGRRQGGQGLQGGATATTAQATTATLMTLSITETSGGTQTTLPTTTLSRPCYLVDLQNVASPAVSGTLALNGGALAIQWDGVGDTMTYANIHANGGTMDSWPAITTFTTGTVAEMVVTGAAGHPLHTHVNPFQITNMGGTTSYNNDYFLLGDWHDTLQLADAGGASITVRQQVYTFTGKEVVHCHILEHEDQGMMGYITISGTEGAGYADAKTIDSTCYDSAYTASTAAPTAATTTSSSGGLSTGALIGIIVGCVAAVVIILGVVIWVVRSKSSGQSSGKVLDVASTDNTDPEVGVAKVEFKSVSDAAVSKDDTAPSAESQGAAAPPTEAKVPRVLPPLQVDQ